MVSRVIANTDFNDLNDGGVVFQILNAASTSDRDQYIQISNLLTLFSLDSTEGDDLDRRAEEYNPVVIRRRPATKGTGSIRFIRTVTVSSLTINEGTEVYVPGSNPRIRYFTQADVTMVIGEDTSAFVNIESEKTGDDYNVVADALSGVKGAPGITGTDHASIGNALDKELDDDFRFRIKRLVEGLARCTVSAIEANLINTEDVEYGETALSVLVVEDIATPGLSYCFIDDSSGNSDEHQVLYIPRSELVDGGTSYTSGTPIDIRSLFTEDTFPLPDDADVLVEFYDDGTSTYTKVDEGSGTGQYSLNRTTGILIYYDNIIAVDKLTFSSEQTIIESISGGESYIKLEDDQFPLDSDINATVVRLYDASEVAPDDYVILTPDTGSGGDYVLDESKGIIELVTALDTDDKLFISGRVWRGLVKECSRLVEGMTSDRENYPGLRAAGTKIILDTPEEEHVAISVTLVLEDTYTLTTVQAAVELEWTKYFGGLAIGEDVIRTELIRRAKAVPGVYDLILTNPVSNIIVDNSLTAEIARLQSVSFV